MKDLSLYRSVSALLALFRFTFVIIIAVSGKFRDAYTSVDGGLPPPVNSWIQAVTFNDHSHYRYRDTWTQSTYLFIGVHSTAYELVLSERQGALCLIKLLDLYIIDRSFFFFWVGAVISKMGEIRPQKPLQYKRFRLKTKGIKETKREPVD